MLNRKNGVLRYVLCFTITISFFILPPSITPSGLTKAYANWLPLGSPDLEIQLSKPSFAPINLTSANYDLILSDLSELPDLANQTIMPHVRDVFLRNNNTLHNQFVENIVVVYDMDKKMLEIDITSKPHDLVRQTFNITSINDHLSNKSQDQEMSVIRQVLFRMPVYWNYTQENVRMHVAIMDRLEQFTLERTQILTDQAVGAFTMHKYDLLSRHEQYYRSNNSLSHITLQMLSFEIARATANYGPDPATGFGKKAFDEIRSTGYLLIN